MTVRMVTICGLSVAYLWPICGLQVYITCQVLKCIEVEWEAKEEDERLDLLQQELWLPQKRQEWEDDRALEREEQRRERVQSAQYKRYKRFIKKQ